MQVGQQKPPVADCFHRRSYLFMLSHFHFSDMIVFLTHQPFIIQKSSNIHFFCHNPFHGIFRWDNSVQCLPHLLSVTSEDWFQYFYVLCYQTISRFLYTAAAIRYEIKNHTTEITSTILKANWILSFTGIKRFVRSTSPTITPVDAIKDIIKTIWDFSGSNK